MENFVLEACVDSLKSAIEAELGGAKRIELCSSLIIGGISPGRGLVTQVKKHTNLEVRVLLRPRFGDFCYNDYEIEEMLEDIRMYKDLGVDGIVTGVLVPDGSLNMPVMERICKEAAGMDMALHRAFDMARDPFKTLEDAKRLGIKTVLTSGQKESAIKGKELLKDLVSKGQGKVEILMGGGIKPSIIEELVKYTGSRSIHMSGKKIIDSKMEYRRKEVSMGLAGISEYDITRTDRELIRQAIDILRHI